MSPRNTSSIISSGDVHMPAVGLGTWQLMGEDMENAMEVAIDAGYRHIDTSYYYMNESVIGKALKNMINSGKITRDEIFIVTKLPPIANRPDKVERFLTLSLEALQLDYVDMYLIHYPIGFTYKSGELFPKLENGEFDLDFEVDHLKIWEKMEEQVDAGRAKAIGVSNFGLDQLKNVMENSRIKPKNIQVELQIYLQQKELVSYCHENNIIVTAYGPLGSPNLIEFTEMIGCSTEGMKKDLIPLKDPVIAEIAKAHGKTPAQILLRYLVEYGCAVIPKSVHPARIKENIDIFDFELTEEEFKQISDLDLGEDGRLFMAKGLLAGLDKHPLYPHPS